MNRVSLALAAAAFVALSAVAAGATTRTLCASGCTFTNSGANLQAAINASVAGDEILLQQGITYTLDGVIKEFTCAAQNATCFVTIRTGVTSTGGLLAASIFPATNIRITPAYASVLAKITPLNNNVPALKTASPPAVVRWWRLQQVEFIGNTYGGSSLIQLGDDDRTVQTKKADIPGPFELIQVLVHGNPVRGQFRGLSALANGIVVKDSYFYDIKSQLEGQVIWTNSNVGTTLGVTPTYTNTYMEGGSETFLSGGSGGCCIHHVAVQASPAPTTTSATLATIEDLVVGQGISLTVAGIEQYVEVASCGTSTPGAACTSTAITWAPAATAAPDVPGEVDWGLTPGDVIFTKNYLTKQMALRNPIIGTPQSVSATTIEDDVSGTLLVGTYAYKVVAKLNTNSGQVARSTASAEVSASIIGNTGSVRISWAAVANADSYDIYGRTKNGENIRWSVTAPTTTFTDTGTAGTTAAVPTTVGSGWNIKNVFEIKNANNWFIEGNVIENVWVSGQTGSIVLFTPVNQNGSNDSTKITNMTFQNNIVRNGAAGYVITCRDVNFSNSPTGRTSNILISNNLSYNINTTFGNSSNRMLYTSAGSSGAFPYQVTTPNTLACKDITVNHNTWIMTSGNAVLWLDDFKGGVARQNENWDMTNNILWKIDYTILGGNACAPGAACWTPYTDAASSWNKNVVVGESCSTLPGGTGSNFCPSVATMQGYFTNYTGNDFRLLATSPYHNAATDGTDIGAIIPTITPFTDIAVSGDNSGAPPPTPPNILTTTLPQGIVSTPYLAVLNATNCGTSCSWTVTTGSLPTGVTLNTNGTMGGTPAVAGSFDLILQATASTPTLFDQQAYTITISSPPPEPVSPRPPVIDWVEGGIFIKGDDEEPTTDPRKDAARFGDLWVSTTARVWRWLAQTDPAPKWYEFLQKVDGSAIASIGASGTPSSLTFLRGDNTWATPPGGGTVVTPPRDFLFESGGSGSVTWTLATTQNEMFAAARNRYQIDLTGMTQCRIWAKVTQPVAGATATIWAQYSTDNGSTWFDLGSTAQTPAITAASSTGIDKGPGYVNIATGAKADVQLRWVGIASVTPTTSPSFGNMGMNCK